MTRPTILLVLGMLILAQTASPAHAQFDQPANEREVFDERAPENSAAEIKIFKLQHADASQVAQVVNQILGISAAVDQRLNVLIVRDRPENLSAIEALLSRLDEPAPVRPAQADELGTRVNAAEDPVTSAALSSDGRLLYYFGVRDTSPGNRELASLVEQSEGRAAQLARQIRELQASGGNRADLVGLKTRLVGEIDKAFDARQQLQRLEVAALAQRLSHIQGVIDARDKIKLQIIDRRIEELLDPQLRWDAMSSNSKAAPPPLAGGNAAKATPEAPPLALENSATPQATTRLATPIPAQAIPGPESSSSGRVNSAPTVDLGVLRAKLDASKALLKAIEAAFQAGQATLVEAQTARSDVKIAEAELAAAERRYQAERELLEIELRQADARLQVAMRDLQRVEQLVKSGAIPGKELNRLKAAYEEAQLAKVLAEARLESHLSSNASADPLEGTTTASEKDPLLPPPGSTDAPSAPPEPTPK